MRGAAGPSTTPLRTTPAAGATWTSAALGTKCAPTASASREPASRLSPQPDTAAANGGAPYSPECGEVDFSEVRTPCIASVQHLCVRLSTPLLRLSPNIRSSL